MRGGDVTRGADMSICGADFAKFVGLCAAFVVYFIWLSSR